MMSVGCKAMVPQNAFEECDEFNELLAEGLRCHLKNDWRGVAGALRGAIALKPHRHTPYYNLGAALANSEHYVEAAQRFLEAMERFPAREEKWAEATAQAFDTLKQEECDEVVKPEWWNDEMLKALSAMVVKAAPNGLGASIMRADVLRGRCGAWEVGPRSAAELKEAAALYERVVALHYSTPAMEVFLDMKAEITENASQCRSRAEAMKPWIPQSWSSS